MDLFREEPFASWCKEYGPKNVITACYVAGGLLILVVIMISCALCKCCHDLLCCMFGCCFPAGRPDNVVYLRMQGEEGGPRYEQV